MKENIFWVDTHCHLEMIDDKIEAILQRAEEKNVKHMVSIGTEQKSNELLLDVIRRYPNVSATLGIHPHEADSFTDKSFNFLENNLFEEGVVAIGECGLDYFYTKSKPENQRKAFEKSLKLAVKNEMPIVVHTRNAEKETMEILKDFDGENLSTLFHCFTSNLELAEFGWEREYYFSFNGIATYKKSEDIRAILKQTPKNRILLETDSPYLAPNPVRGKKNEPAFLEYTGNILAEFLEMTAEEFAKLNMENAQNFYKNLNLFPSDSK